MSKKKTDVQRANVGSNSKHKDNHVSVGDEMQLMTDNLVDSDLVNYNIPEDEDEFYGLLVNCSKGVGHRLATEPLILKMIVRYYFNWRKMEDMIDDEGAVLIEVNGNTGKEVRKEHPAAKLSSSYFEKMLKLLRENGLTKTSFIKLVESASTINANNFASNFNKNKDEGSMEDWADQANPED